MSCGNGTSEMTPNRLTKHDAVTTTRAGPCPVSWTTDTRGRRHMVSPLIWDNAAAVPTSDMRAADTCEAALAPLSAAPRTAMETSTIRPAAVTNINTSTSNGASRTTSTVVDPRLPLNGQSPRRTTPVAVPVFWSHCEEETERQTGPAPPLSP